MSRYLSHCLIFFFACVTSAAADSFTLLVQPVQEPGKTRAAFAPLTDYLSKTTGQDFSLVTVENYLKHSRRHADPAFADFVLDAAHFTGFRAANRGYQVLASVGDVVSYSWATSIDAGVLDVDDLVSRKVAIPSSPSLGSVLFDERFGGQLIAPAGVPYDSLSAALSMLDDGSVAAILLPTPMLAKFPDLVVLEQTKQVRPMAFSASPRVDSRVVHAVRRALIGVSRTSAGRAMLTKVNLPEFAPATNEDYLAFDALLKFHWRDASGQENMSAVAGRDRLLSAGSGVGDGGASLIQ